MEYCIVDSNGVIVNIIVCDSEIIAEQFGAKKSYNGATIGCNYKPPYVPTVDEQIKLLSAQLKAQTERSDFIEDCIAEMATQVYGGV